MKIASSRFFRVQVRLLSTSVSSHGDHLGDLVARYHLLRIHSFFFFLSGTVLEDRPGNEAYRLGKQTGIREAAVFNVLGDYICAM